MTLLLPVSFFLCCGGREAKTEERGSKYRQETEEDEWNKRALLGSCEL